MWCDTEALNYVLVHRKNVGTKKPKDINNLYVYRNQYALISNLNKTSAFKFVKAA